MLNEISPTQKDKNTTWFFSYTECRSKGKVEHDNKWGMRVNMVDVFYIHI
jgi:hypothetical protein